MNTDPIEPVDWRAIAGEQNLLVLATHPGDETTLFGGLIARACASGRPPFVAVLTDGSAGAGPGAHASAMQQERAVRAATVALGLDPDRLLFVGLFQGSVPRDGPLAEAVVAAIDLVMWRNDCRVLCAAADGDADTRAAANLAHAAAARTGLPLILRTGGMAAGSKQLDTSAVQAVLQRARSVYPDTAAPSEFYRQAEAV